MTESLPPDAPDLSATQYVLEKLLGQGGFGAAYLAFNRGLRRRCVMKVLTDTNNSGFVARFYREAQVMANLEHPTIPRVYEVATTKDGQPFFVMEFVDGKSLGEHLADEGGVLPVPESCRLIADAAEGLAAAHESGVVHRDVKLANLLVNKRGQMKVIDFGIAKKTVAETDQTAGILTRKGDLFGTPRYMSPEQAMSKSLGPPSDFYSLGIVLFILLTGTSPFNGTAHEMMTGHVMTPPPKLSDVAGRPFPPAIEALVARLLAKDPSARFDNGIELAAALRAVGGVTPLSTTGSQSWSTPGPDPIVARDAMTPAPTERASMRFEEPVAPRPAPATSPRRTELQLGETVRRLLVSEPSIALPPLVLQTSFAASTASVPAVSVGATVLDVQPPNLHTDTVRATPSMQPRDSAADYAQTELALPAVQIPLPPAPPPQQPPTFAANPLEPSAGPPAVPVPAGVFRNDFAKKDVTPSSLQTSVALPLAPVRTRWMMAVVVPVAAVVLGVGGYFAWAHGRGPVVRRDDDQTNEALPSKQAPPVPSTVDESPGSSDVSPASATVVSAPESTVGKAAPEVPAPTTSLTAKKVPTSTIGATTTTKGGTTAKTTNPPATPSVSAPPKPTVAPTAGSGAIDDRF